MRTIIKPIITEKTLGNYQKENKVVFEVALNANKVDAKKSLEKLFDVKVDEVKTLTRLGKFKYNRLSRRSSKLKDKKYMIFRLNESSKLDLFEVKDN